MEVELSVENIEDKWKEELILEEEEEEEEEKEHFHVLAVDDSVIDRKLLERLLSLTLLSSCKGI